MEQDNLSSTLISFDTSIQGRLNRQRQFKDRSLTVQLLSLAFKQHQVSIENTSFKWLTFDKQPFLNTQLEFENELKQFIVDECHIIGSDKLCIEVIYDYWVQDWKSIKIFPP